MGWLEENENYLNLANEKDIENKILQSKEQMDKQNKEDYVNLFLSDEQIKEELKEKLGEENTEEQLQQYLEENYESFIPEQYVVRGARLCCSCGSHERKLNVFKDHAVYTESFPMIHELDKELEKNITFFGVCSSGDQLLSSQNIRLIKTTYDKEGNPIEEVVSGTMCVPFIIGDWRDTKKNVKIIDNGDKDSTDKDKYREDGSKGYKAVTTNSFLICRYGGIIEPLDSGQDLISEQEPVMEELEIEEVLSTNHEDIKTLEDIDKLLNDFEGAFINDNKELFEVYKEIIEKNDNNRDKARKEFREYMLNNNIDIPNLYDYTIKIGDIINESVFVQDNKVHIAVLKDEFSMDNLKGALFETNIKDFVITGYNFINLVNTNKPLDLKNRINKEYNDSIWAMPFDFKGQCVNSEIIENGLKADYIGNFIFGYVGDEIFGYDWFIKLGAGGAQIFSDIFNYGFEKYFDKWENNEYTLYFDNKGDSETIQDGINAKALHNKK